MTCVSLQMLNVVCIDLIVIILAVLAIQAKKKRKNPKGRKSGNAAGKEDAGPTSPGGSAAAPAKEQAASPNNGQLRETRSAQPR